MKNISLPTIILLAITLIAVCFGCFRQGIENPENFWQNLSGEWRLTTTYSVNDEEFDIPVCDQLTVVQFDTLKEDFLKKELSLDTSLTLISYFKVRNNSCDSKFLFFGALLAKNEKLPRTSSFTANLRKKCHNCRYSDIQYIDISTCTTDSFPFSILKLTASELHIRYLGNIFNRFINNEFVLDTIELRFSRSGAGDIQTVQPFKMDDYLKKKWLRFESNDWCNTANTNTGSVSIATDGIDANCIYFGNQSSSICADIDLRSAVGLDNKVTLSFWIKPVTLDRPRQVIYSKYENSYGPFVFSLKYNKMAIAINNGSGNLQEIVSVNSLKSNEWNHICYSYNNQNLLLCIDGKSDSRVHVNSFLNDATGDALIGNAKIMLPDQVNPRGFNGYMDEIIIFEDYLSQGEVFQLYQWHLNN